ncbi:copper amine oxidase domain protein [[Eubacterium] yurii subsp. margaretiae ATCC 43715]|nr:copper amine oxidase domain protein [[Eubacterium] yurii subsp. margaretiae ATCC 43715]
MVFYYVRGGFIMLKQKFLRALAFTVFSLAIANSAFAIDIYYKDKLVPTDTSPVIEEGRTLVPISSIAGSMGAKVQWDKATKTAIIEQDSVKLELVLGSKNVNITKDGKKSQLVLDVPARAIDGRTMVPIRAISEIFGSKVEWDKETSSILIDSASPKKTETTSPKITDTVPPKDTSNSNLEKTIQSLIKGHRTLYRGILISGNEKVSIDTDYDLDMVKIPMALLNERIPSSYLPFTVYEAGTQESILSGFIDKTTNKIYLQSSDMIYSIPDYNIIVPPFSNNFYDDTYNAFIKAIATRDKLISIGDGVECETANINEDKRTADVKISKNNKLIATYSIDVNNRKVTNLKTNEVVYDDSAIQGIKETFIEKNQAGDMAISILKKLKRISADKKYTISDLEYTEGDQSTDSRNGYIFTLKLDGKIIGQFLINTTSTVMMEYDANSKTYFYIMGAFTPFG